MNDTKTQARTTRTSRSGTDSPMVRAAIYVRISQDREGAGLGVARQEDDCRALCGRKGWQVAGLYAVNDVSAYSGKPRPQWGRLLADIAAGHLDAVACWHVDRLTRSPRELEDVIDLHDKHGVQLATVTGEIDLSTPTGRLVARTLARRRGMSPSTSPSGCAAPGCRPPNRAARARPADAATAPPPTTSPSSQPTLR